MSSDIIGKRIVNSLDKEIHLISDFRNTDIKSVVICDAIVLDYTDEEGCARFLTSIRSSFIDSIYLIPIFILSSDKITDPIIISHCEVIISLISDDIIVSTLNKINRLNVKYIPIDLFSTEERLITKLLRYMHSRGLALTPFVNKHSHIGYEYPILSLHYSNSNDINKTKNYYN